MHNRHLIPLLATAAAALAAATTTSHGQSSWTQVGMLNCTVAPSVGFIIAGQQRMACQFVPNQSAAGPNQTTMPENYSGVMKTVGIDIGATAGGKLAWAVLSPTDGPSAGGLAGTYVGASGDVTIGIGAGANVLIGGSGRSVALQPLSVEGSTGLNLQLGMSGLELTPAP